MATEVLLTGWNVTQRTWIVSPESAGGPLRFIRALRSTEGPIPFIDWRVDGDAGMAVVVWLAESEPPPVVLAELAEGIKVEKTGWFLANWAANVTAIAAVLTAAGTLGTLWFKNRELATSETRVKTLESEVASRSREVAEKMELFRLVQSRPTPAARRPGPP